MSLRMPAEHGAWGILVVPMLCAAAVAGAWNFPLALFVVSSLALFLLRGSMEAQGGWRSWPKPAHLLLASIALGSGVYLLLAFARWQLLGLAAAGAGLYGLQTLLVRRHDAGRHEKRSLAAELVGVTLLTLVAPGAWIAARGGLHREGLEVWLLNLLFFLGGVLYVKYRVRSLLAHQPFADWESRLRFAWPVFAYHLLLIVFLFTWIWLGAGPAAVLMAFAPGVLRAHGLVFQLGARFPIKRLGWTEVAHSAVFAALLILALQLS